MKKQKLSTETIRQVWDDELGTHIDVKEDLDGLEMVEVKFYEGLDKDNEPFNSIMMTVGEAELVAQHLMNLVKEMREKYPECEANVME